MLACALHVRACMQWGREVQALYRAHDDAERDKEWKRLRYGLVRHASLPLEDESLAPERRAEVERMRVQVRARMSARARVHMCTCACGRV